MFPDLRVVTIAVFSTFLFAATVGFYTSWRLVNERKPGTHAAIDHHSYDRIALNWPESEQSSSDTFNLDFADAAKLQRNRVWNVGDELSQTEPKIAGAPPTSNRKSAVETMAPQVEPIAGLPAANMIEAVPVYAAIEPKSQLEVTKSPIKQREFGVQEVQVHSTEMPIVKAINAHVPQVESATLPVVVGPNDDDMPTTTILEVPSVNPASEQRERKLELLLEPPAFESPKVEAAKVEVPYVEVPKNPAVTTWPVATGGEPQDDMPTGAIVEVPVAASEKSMVPPAPIEVPRVAKHSQATERHIKRDVTTKPDPTVKKNKPRLAPKKAEPKKPEKKVVKKVVKPIPRRRAAPTASATTMSVDNFFGQGFRN